MSVMAKFTVSSSGALSRVSRRAALIRTAAFPEIDRMAAGKKGRETIKVLSHPFPVTPEMIHAFMVFLKKFQIPK